jgi:5-methylcytosine-specific restriction protein A
MSSDLYHSVCWRKVRANYLSANPLCVMCIQEGRDEPANVVDHKTPHNDDPILFWAESNFQALCTQHHNSIKQTQEIHGYSQAAGIDGQPLDPLHPWNRR